MPFMFVFQLSYLIKPGQDPNEVIWDVTADDAYQFQQFFVAYTLQ